jgi:dimethylaniline monooxygenase (N-oxide forming)
MAPTVAVIGAGPLGLAATKELKAEGFDVTTFDRQPYIGGIWKHTAEPRISVNPNTIFNTSRPKACFTDFPFEDTVSDFPTGDQMLQYLERYADHFHLRQHIKLNTAVQDVSRVAGRWQVTLETPGKKQYHQQFDKVMYCSGSFTTPKRPRIPGIEKFEGDVQHSVTFSPTEYYRGKNVLLIGAHATAVDVASSLSGIASQVYMSHKHGFYAITRYTPDGRPWDKAINLNLLFFVMIIERIAPRLWTWLLDTMLSKGVRDNFPKLVKDHGVLPAPSISTTTPVMWDQVNPHIEDGSVELIRNVECVSGPKSVKLFNGRVIDDLDAIVFCTGYQFDVPSAPTGFHPYPELGKPPKLFMVSAAWIHCLTEHTAQ